MGGLPYAGFGWIQELEGTARILFEGKCFKRVRDFNTLHPIWENAKGKGEKGGIGRTAEIEKVDSTHRQ
jgi:hypothetical protein